MNELVEVSQSSIGQVENEQKLIFPKNRILKAENIQGTLVFSAFFAYRWDILFLIKFFTSLLEIQNIYHTACTNYQKVKEF
jgi:hypothetical protein